MGKRPEQGHKLAQSAEKQDGRKNVYPHRFETGKRKRVAPVTQCRHKVSRTSTTWYQG